MKKRRNFFRLRRNKGGGQLGRGAVDWNSTDGKINLTPHFGWENLAKNDFLNIFVSFYPIVTLIPYLF